MGEKKEERHTIVLKRGREISVLRRHPWIFSGAVETREGAVGAGSLVEVRSYNGKFLGVGHWGSGGIAVRMLSFDPIASESGLMAQRVREALELREALGLVKTLHTDTFRLIHGEGDQLPGLIVDIYGEVAVVQCHSYGMWRLREEIGEILKGIDNGGLRIDRVVYKQARSGPDMAVQETDSGEDSAGLPSESDEIDPSRLVSVVENGNRFLVDVVHGQKTGFFLDQRDNRKLLQQYSRDKQVLNAFSYTGGFSVYALTGGASWVNSIDSSKQAISLCRQNVALNFPEANHSAEVADCFKYLEGIDNTYDLIVLDPPAFAKHQRAVKRGVRGYETINALAIKGIKPGGIMFTFSCSQLISRELFRDAVLRAAAEVGRPVRIMHQLHQASCHPINLFHPEGDYLKGLVLKID